MALQKFVKNAIFLRYMICSINLALLKFVYANYVFKLIFIVLMPFQNYTRYLKKSLASLELIM